MAIGVLALVGTRWGLFTLRGDDDRRGWRVDGPLLDGWGVYHAMVDARDGTFYAAANHIVYGPTVQRSADGGKTWQRSKKIGLPGWSGLTLNATWHIEPGLAQQPGTLYLGADPGLLFRSDDAGETWEPNRGILEHPTRDRWFPGRGGLCCDSIQLDPGNPQRMYVCITAAGTLRSDDGGQTWLPANKNVATDYLPSQYPEIGQCVHKLMLHPARPERLWQQNHCGVYRSDNCGNSWERLDGNGLPSDFGFPIMIDPKDPDKAFVIPEKSFEYHYGPIGRLAVYRTRDGGQTWEEMSDGLPQPAWATVLREASASDADSLYFGTQSGSFFALADGDTWVEAARHLPPIVSVEVTQWSGSLFRASSPPRLRASSASTSRRRRWGRRCGRCPLPTSSSTSGASGAAICTCTSTRRTRARGVVLRARSPAPAKYASSPRSPAVSARPGSSG